jgi:hypothetical protein
MGASEVTRTARIARIGLTINPEHLAPQLAHDPCDLLAESKGIASFAINGAQWAG